MNIKKLEDRFYGVNPNRRKLGLVRRADSALGMDEIRAYFSEQFRKKRIKACLSQVTFSKIMRTGEKIVSDWEHGRKLPRINNLYKIANVLGCKAKELLP